MAWVGSLELLYRLEDGRVRAIDRHHGPLRVLKAHHPEGPGLAEHVLVHPPGGLAGGDDLSVRVEVGAGAHARLSTPSATRFYRSLGEAAEQDVDLTLGPGALLEWLPLETLLHGHCHARSRLRARLQPAALFMGWDMVCLGLPASGDGFSAGSFEQDLEIEGLWVESVRLDAQDHVLRRSPVGLDGHPAWASLWLASGTPWPDSQRDALVEVARAVGVADEPLLRLGVSSPDPRLVVVRALAHRIEPIFRRIRRIRQAWWSALGQGGRREPRIWTM